MKAPKIPLAQTLIQLCKAKEIKHIVISPGSRNAPLTMGFTNDPYFTSYSLVDERCAAFFALGIAQQIEHPVALVCTSGSALLNYFPAIAESFYSEIPLVVLSADRPKYLVGIGDGQTINQKDVYGSHVLYSANLKLDIDEDKEPLIDNKDDLKIFKSIENTLEKFLGMQQTIQQENEHEINRALNTSVINRGPVHINCPLDEPLYETVDDYTINVENKTPSLEDSNQDIDGIAEFASIWNSAKRKMILVGVNSPNQVDQELLNTLAKDGSVLVFTETTSNLHHDSFFPSIDQMIMPLDDSGFKALQPDILITFGGMVVSKKIKAFLRKHQPKKHWHVGGNKANDTFFCLNAHIHALPNSFFKQLLKHTSAIGSDYHSVWNTIKQHRLRKHVDYLNTIEFSDFKAFDVLLKSLPDAVNLHLGNSSTVRYTQLFDLNKTVHIFCNRGTSGIDGSTSTAIGVASVTEKQNICITGDLSFFYDSNALWNNYIKNTFRIIVINNAGGGIFRILPGHKNTNNFDTYFETKHDLNAEQLCKMYGFEYVIAHDEAILTKELSTFYSKSKQPRLLEIFTPRTSNDEILLDYFKFIK